MSFPNFRFWEWVRLPRYDLTAGEHVLTVGYRENGAGLDKVSISNTATPPE